MREPAGRQVAHRGLPAAHQLGGLSSAHALPDSEQRQLHVVSRVLADLQSGPDGPTFRPHPHKFSTDGKYFES